MTAEEMKKLLALLGLLALTGCGASPNSPSAAIGVSTLAIEVTGAKSFNPNIEHGKIEKYRVKIEGEGIVEPIVEEFAGDATTGVVEGVPVGQNRKISVEAANSNETVVRAGEEEDVEVGSGETSVKINLEAVPVFANLTNDSVVDNTRLVLRVFSDPAHPVAIEDETSATTAPIIDAATSKAEIELDANTGLGKIAPTVLSAGEHKFIVRDLITGRSSEVKVRLMDGTKRKPAPIVAASVVSKKNIARAGGLPPLP